MVADELSDAADVAVLSRLQDLAVVGSKRSGGEDRPGDRHSDDDGVHIVAVRDLDAKAIGPEVVVSSGCSRSPWGCRYWKRERKPCHALQAY